MNREDAEDVEDAEDAGDSDAPPDSAVGKASCVMAAAEPLGRSGWLELGVPQPCRFGVSRGWTPLSKNGRHFKQ